MKGYSVGALENTKQKVSLPFFQASYLCRLSFFYLHLSSFVFYLNLFHASGLGRGRLRGASSRERGFLCHHQRPRHLQSNLGLLSWGLQNMQNIRNMQNIQNMKNMQNMQNMQNMLIEPTLPPPPLVLRSASDCNDFWSRWSFVSWVNISFNFIYPFRQYWH